MKKERNVFVQKKQSCKNCKYGCETPVTGATTRLVCKHPNALLTSAGVPPLTMACRVNNVLCGMSMRWFEMK